MKQSAAQRPEPSFQRKAAIAHGAAMEHTGHVVVEPIPNFDLDRTIFQTLEGKAARFVMSKRVGKEVYWDDKTAQAVQEAYDSAQEKLELPEVDAGLLQFMVDECDFDVEHADGSFLDHLYFCFEYTALHYPEQSALPMLLHSILGTGTNTFAMTADKIPSLRSHLGDFDWAHTEAFPSVLRLLYAGNLRQELRSNLNRLGSLKSIRMHRVIDNQPLELSADDLWIALNYQLIHLVDFLPAANWATHLNDTSFILFRDLYDLLSRAGQLQAKIDYTPANSSDKAHGEHLGLGGWLTTLIPVSASEKMAAKSVTRFSERIGHSLDYTLNWG